MNTTSIADAAVAVVNERRQSQVTAQGVELVNGILDAQREVANQNKNIDGYRTELNKIVGGDITAQTVLGTDLPTTGANAATVARVLETLNKAKQEDIKLTSGRLAQAITNAQDAIAKLTQVITDKQAKLLALSADDVTKDQVVGSTATA
jgi:hypothetical protein